MVEEEPITKVWGPGDQPFVTTDNIIAYALYLAFQNFADDAWPCFNEYTFEQLVSLGYRGMKPQEAAIQAAKDGNKGKVTYVFRNIDSRIMKAFADEMQVMKNAEGQARDRIRQVIDMYSTKVIDYQEMIARVVATFCYMRGEFLTMWQRFEPLIRLDTPQRRSERTLPNGEVLVETNGFRYVGAHASEATVRRIQNG